MSSGGAAEKISPTPVAFAGSVYHSMNAETAELELSAKARAMSEAREALESRSAQVSAVGTLRSAFSALRTAVNALSSNTAALARSTKLTSDVRLQQNAGAAHFIIRHPRSGWKTLA